MLLFYLSMVSSEEDKKLIEKIYLEHRDAMTYVALGILKSPQRAEDAVHDSFLKIIEGINSKKIVEKSCPQMKALCVITCRNTALNMSRRESSISFVDNEVAFDTVGDTKLTDDLVVASMEHAVIVEALRNLPLIFHDIMVLSLVEELPTKEIAKITSLPLETVKKRLQRGRKILISELGKAGIL